MAISWQKISPEAFEELCYHLLESMGFANLIWHGRGGGDRGRDLTADLATVPLQGTQQITHWVVQCKRWTKKPLSKLEMDEAIVSAREHSPTHFLIITTRNLTSGTHDWIDSERKRQPFQIEVWESPKLEGLLRERLDKLRPWIPEELRRELQVGEYAPSSEVTRIEDVLGRNELRTKRSLKEQVFGATEILRDEVYEGPVYGQSVVLRQGSLVKGDVFARKDVKADRGAKVTGSVLCPGSIEIVECELGDICGSQIAMQGQCTVNGILVTDRDLAVAPGSKIASIACGGRKLEIGEGSEIGSATCKGVTMLGNNVKVAGELKSADVRLRPGCQVGQISCDGDVSIPENTSVGSLSANGLVKVDTRIRMAKLHTTGDVELLSGGSVDELWCRSLTAGGETVIGKLRSTGTVTMKDEEGRYRGEFLSAEGDVSLPDDTAVKILASRADVSLGKACQVTYLVAHSLRSLEGLHGGTIRCLGSVDLGENCTVESLHAVGNIKFKEGFRSIGWTIFSQRGVIQGRGSAKLGDTEVPVASSYKYGEGTILTALMQEAQLKLIENREGDEVPS